MERNFEHEEKFLICPLTLEIMDDPVIALDGFTYERTAIESWFLKSLTSPMTNQSIPSKTLISNHVIKSQIVSYREKVSKVNELKELEELKAKKRAFKLYLELDESQKQIIDEGYSEYKKYNRPSFKTAQREWDNLTDNAKCLFLRRTPVSGETYDYLTKPFRAFLSFFTQIMRHNLKGKDGTHPSNNFFWNQNPQLQVEWIEKFFLDSTTFISQ